MRKGVSSIGDLKNRRNNGKIANSFLRILFDNMYMQRKETMLVDKCKKARKGVYHNDFERFTRVGKKEMLNFNFQTEFLKWGTKEGICDIEYDRHMKIFARKSNLKRATNDSVYDNEDDQHMKIFRINRARHEAC